MSEYLVKLEDHAKFAEEINELIERLVHLQINIAIAIGKTKARTISNKIAKTRDTISSVRWDLENLMLKEFPDAPLYTSYREYRRQ